MYDGADLEDGTYTDDTPYHNSYAFPLSEIQSGGSFGIVNSASDYSELNIVPVITLKKG